MKTEYVLGFMFDRGNVALIRKKKPKWQEGLLNGIGGKIEANEGPFLAMVREFEEETGLHQKLWNHFATMSGPDFKVYCFMCHGPVIKLKSMESEQVEIHSITGLPISECIPNLKWLIPMALDTDRIFSNIQYAQ